MDDFEYSKSRKFLITYLMKVLIRKFLFFLTLYILLSIKSLQSKYLVKSAKWPKDSQDEWVQSPNMGAPACKPPRLWSNGYIWKFC